jgi:hypothetical protein
MATRPKPRGWEGFAAGVIYWLFFMLGFFLLNYDPFISICFGALGGLASGVIANWWQSKGEAAAKTSLESEAELHTQPKGVQSGSRPRFQRYGLRGTRPRKAHRTRGQRRFGWMFRKAR